MKSLNTEIAVAAVSWLYPRLLEEPAHQPLHLPPPRRRRGDAEPLGAQHTLLDDRGEPDLGDTARSHVLGEAAYEPLIPLR
jgi:hypothetical protein